MSEDPSPKVVLKGEIHTSSGDLNQERDLLLEGFDAVVFEGAESDPEYRIWEGWFNLLFILFDSTVGHLYQDSTILIDLADALDTDISFTRESDSEILRNTPVLVHLFAATAFYLLIAYSLYRGAVDNLVSGSLGLLFAVVFPLLVIRLYNTKFGKGSLNRDEIIAQKIVEASTNNDRVLCIIGAAHAPGVKKRLPDDFEVEYVPPKYGMFSLHHARDLTRPGFTAFAELYLIYLIMYYAFFIFLV